MHTISSADRSFMEQEFYRLMAMNCVYQYCPKLRPLADATFIEMVRRAKVSNQITQKDWAAIQAKKQTDFKAIQEYNHQLTLQAQNLFKKPDSHYEFKQILEIKKYIILLIGAMSAQSHHDVKLVDDKIAQIRHKPAALTETFIYLGAMPSDSFKAADRARLGFNVYRNKLENFLNKRYEEGDACYSWWTRSCKLTIALQSYDALMMADIDKKEIVLPEHKQGRLGDILGGCEFDLSSSFTIKHIK